MPTKMVRQTMWSTGEVDEQVWKRTDIAEYNTAAQRLLNCEVSTTGVAKKRKGTRLKADVSVYTQINSNGYEFIDKNGVYYALISRDTHFSIFSFINGTLTFVQDLVTPYVTADLDDIDYTQDNDSLVLTHPNYAPGRIYISAYGTPNTFAFQYLNIYPLPSYDFNTINYNAFTVNLVVSGNQLTFQFTGVGPDPGFNVNWVGGQIIGGGASPEQPVGYAIITSAGYDTPGGGTVTFYATIQIPFQESGFATQGSQYSVRQPAWSASLGYPAKVLYFQNRLWLGNTRSLPNTLFGSKINTPINFDVGTGKDTDAIVYTIGQTNSGGILWMNGGKQLEVFCQDDEFACPQDQNSGLTPSTFSIRQQSSYGSSPLLKPITYINDSYYATKTGKSLINYHFTGVGLTYQSSNISAASQHLVKNPTNRALQRGSDTSQDNFIYFLNQTDNTITTFQFAGEYKLAALTPCVFQDDILLVDIFTVNNTIFIIKFYDSTDKYTLEVFDPTVKVDCAFEATMDSSGVVSGLSLLNEYTVQVIFDNQDFGQYVVQDGSITVLNPDQDAGTVTIGLLYDVDITLMYLFGGTSEAPFFKNMSRIYVDYYQSLNFYINGTLVPYQNFAFIQDELPLVPQTDTAIINPVSGYSRFSTFSITQSSPFDLQILSVAYQIEVSVL